MPKTKKRGLRNIILNVSLSIVTVLIFIVFLEIGLRVFYPQPVTPSFLSANDKDTFAEYDSLLGWKLKPNAEGIFFSEEYQTTIKNNNQGLRMNKNILLEKSKYRIAFLGDSFIWGSGVNDEERISEITEKNLENVEVINFGVSGYGADQEYLQLNKTVLKYNPDLVILAFYVNDLEDAGNKIRYNYPKPLFKIEGDGSLNLTNVPVPEIKKDEEEYSLTTKINLYLSHNSHTFVLIKPFLKKLINPDREGKMYGWSDISLIKKDYTEEYKQYQELNNKLYCKISNLLKEKEIPLIVVNIPAKSYILDDVLNQRLENLDLGESEIDLNKPSEMMLELSKECDFYFVDLYPDFKNYKNKKNLYFKYDDHWTEEGHRYASEILTNNIEKWEIINQ